MPYAYENVDIPYDDTFFTPDNVVRGKALAESVRKNPALAAPTSGVAAPGAYDQGQYTARDVGLAPPEQPQRAAAATGGGGGGLPRAKAATAASATAAGMPGATAGAEAAATPDYRALALKKMLEAGEAAPQESDLAQLREYARGRDERSNRDLMMGFMLSATGGESLAPVGGHMLKQALAAQEPLKLGGGVIEGGKFIKDPEVDAQRRTQRLETQAKIYESMAQHAETLEQKREATQAARELRSQLAAGTASRAGERAEEQRGARSFTQENTLRDDFEKQVKDQRISIGTFPQIEAALSQPVPTAAGDMRAIFRYMKMLDPTSVVREGEYATARNAAGIPERIQTAYNNARAGTSLSAEQRADFLNQARSERDTALEYFNQRAAEFHERARRYGLTPANVVIGYDMTGGGAGGGGGAVPPDTPPPNAVRRR